MISQGKFSLTTFRRRLLTASVLTLASAASAAYAQEAETETEETGDQIVVVGRRVSDATLAVGVDETSNTVSVTRAALLSAPAGVSGLKALEGLPGFNVQTDGALGLYEFGNSVTVRAFNFSQIGFTLDGIPMGRPDAFGGSPIFRYVDNENLNQVRASPGAGDVSVPSATSLGPITEYFTTPTSDEFGGVISVTLGDDNLQRTFIKLETGDINGFSAYVSRSKTDSDLWRGPGTIDREHIEGKVQYAFDDDTVIRAQMVYNDFFDYDSPSMSEAGYLFGSDAAGRTGRDQGYLGFIPDLGGFTTELDGSVTVDVVNPDGEAVVFANSGYTQYYIDRVNVREDLLLGLTFETDVTETTALTLTGYFEKKDGFGVSPDSYGNTLNQYNEQLAAGVETAFGLDLDAPRGVQYGLSTVGGDRYGGVAHFSWTVGDHVVELGGWYEYEEYDRLQQRLNKVGGNPAGAPLYDEVAYYRRDYTSTREFMQYYLKDTVKLLDDRLTIEAGFKGLFLDYEIDGFRDYDDYSRVVNGTPVIGFGPQVISQSFDEAFLPMVGAVLSLTDTEQLFASFAQNFALPRAADDLFDNTLTPEVDGERSTNYELGLRTNRPTFNAALTGYFVQFEDRIEVAGRPVAGQQGAIETIGQNVGDVDAYGIEFTGNWKPAFLGGYAYFTGNLTYNVAEFQDEILSGGGSPLGLPGNELPDTPELLITAGVTVEPTSWAVANITARYTGDRFADFINTQPMETYTVYDAYLDLGEGYGGVGPFKNVKARLNVTNLTDEDVLSFTFTTISGTAFYRPLAPRTVQFSLVGEF